MASKKQMKPSATCELSKPQTTELQEKVKKLQAELDAERSVVSVSPLVCEQAFRCSTDRTSLQCSGAEKPMTSRRQPPLLCQVFTHFFTHVVKFSCAIVRHKLSIFETACIPRKFVTTLERISFLFYEFCSLVQCIFTQPCHFLHSPWSRTRVKQLRREKTVETRQIREHEQNNARIALKDLKAKFTTAKQRELEIQKETLNRRFDSKPAFYKL